MQKSKPRPESLTLQTPVNRVETDPESASEPLMSAIRGMCRGINTDVPNGAEVTEAADQLIILKAAARVESVKSARKISLDDL